MATTRAFAGDSPVVEITRQPINTNVNRSPSLNILDLPDELLLSVMYHLDNASVLLAKRAHPVFLRLSADRTLSRLYPSLYPLGTATDCKVDGGWPFDGKDAFGDTEVPILVPMPANAPPHPPPRPLHAAATGPFTVFVPGLGVVHVAGVPFAPPPQGPVCVLVPGRGVVHVPGVLPGPPPFGTVSVLVGRRGIMHLPAPPLHAVPQFAGLLLRGQATAPPPLPFPFAQPRVLWLRYPEREARDHFLWLIRRDRLCSGCRANLAHDHAGSAALGRWNPWNGEDGLHLQPPPSACSGGCGGGVRHPAGLFSGTQRRNAEPWARKCVGWEGKVRMCLHWEVSWEDVLKMRERVIMAVTLELRKLAHRRKEEGEGRSEEEQEEMTGSSHGRRRCEEAAQPWQWRFECPCGGDLTPSLLVRRQLCYDNQVANEHKAADGDDARDQDADQEMADAPAARWVTSFLYSRLAGSDARDWLDVGVDGVGAFNSDEDDDDDDKEGKHTLARRLSPSRVVRDSVRREVSFDLDDGQRNPVPEWFRAVDPESYGFGEDTETRLLCRQDRRCANYYLRYARRMIGNEPYCL